MSGSSSVQLIFLYAPHVRPSTLREPDAERPEKHFLIEVTFGGALRCT